MKNTKIFIQLFILGLGITACANKQEAKKNENNEKNETFQTMQLQKRHLESSIRIPGVLQPFEVVQIFPRMAGFVKSVSVDRGTIVKKGQLLIGLEAPEMEQQVASAHLKYTQANENYLSSKDKYFRMKETCLTPGTISPYDLAMAKDKMNGDSATTQAEFANYKAQLLMKNYLNITAPFDGVITERNVHPGALVGPGMQTQKPMLVLQQLSKLRLTFDVPEQYASQINTGDSLSFKTDALPAEHFAAIISRMAQSLNNNYRSETIEADIQNLKSHFKPGMYAEIALPIKGGNNAFVVPKTAVVSTTERKYVVLVSNNLAKWMDVKEGNHTADSVEIFGNFSKGDVVVVNANYKIKEGDKVR